jgi:hypothetical protein
MKKTILAFSLALSCLAFFSCSKENVESTSQGSNNLKATWSSSAQWATWTNGGYTLYNNIWGSGAGSQSIWANTYSNWGVWANHPNTSGIKSYPNCEKAVNKTLSSLTTLKSTIRATTPSGGAWESTFDIWCNNYAYEIMLWLNYTGTSTGGGNVKPIAASYDASGNAVPTYTNQTIGGSTWNVYKGSNGSNMVYSFLRTTKTNNVTVDIKAILSWIKTKGWFGDVTVGVVQYGFEITSSYGTNGSGLNFTCNSYSVTAN